MPLDTMLSAPFRDLTAKIGKERFLVVAAGR
jgi:hypothetical protein